MDLPGARDVPMRRHSQGSKCLIEPLACPVAAGDRFVDPRREHELRRQFAPPLGAGDLVPAQLRSRLPCAFRIAGVR